MAANNVPEVCIQQIATAFVRHTEFTSAADAGRELLACGLVGKAWLEATSSDAVWRVLFQRCSPAPVRARDGPLPDKVYQRRDDGAEVETLASKLARSRYFAESITSPFLMPVATVAAPVRDLFRRRVLAARHAASAYRRVGRIEPMFSEPERLLFTCATEAPGGDAPGAAAALHEHSYIFELFELDTQSRERQRGYDESPPGGDFVTEKLRHAFAGPPHHAFREDLGGDTENLLWTATVRASNDGDIQALVPLDDAGRVLRTHTVFVDSGMDDYSSQWCVPWRLVVTAVRDADGKMCQLVDVRGFRIENGQVQPTAGFWEMGEDTCTGTMEFVVGAFEPEKESLRCDIFFGCNCDPLYGPRTQRDASDVSDDEIDASTPEAVAREALSTFMDGAPNSNGVVWEVTLSWMFYEDVLYEGDEDGGWMPRREYNFSPSQVAVLNQSVASKLARLAWT